MSGFFDIAATLFFGVAALLALYMLLFVRRQGLTASSIYLVAAMTVMMAVSAGHIAQQWGAVPPPDITEDYGQVLFIPLVTYAMYSIHARSIAVRAARSERNVERLSERLSDSLNELGESRLGMLQALSTAVDARDHYTALHSIHVADYACAIGQRLGLTHELDILEQAGLLHDIGKIGIPDTVLLKPAQLDDREYETIKTHVESSARILESTPFLSETIPLVLHHHERWDGTGYPAGLAAEEIPLGARILSVADAFDAMTTDRPYRAALDAAKARKVLLEGRGTQFDPAVVDTMVELLDTGVLVLAEKSTVA
ncbi:MAG: HD-GYP domain-containing protein [Coriobacteriia bacterium]